MTPSTSGCWAPCAARSSSLLRVWKKPVEVRLFFLHRHRVDEARRGGTAGRLRLERGHLVPVPLAASRRGVGVRCCRWPAVEYRREVGGDQRGHRPSLVAEGQLVGLDESGWSSGHAQARRSRRAERYNPSLVTSSRACGQRRLVDGFRGARHWTKEWCPLKASLRRAVGVSSTAGEFILNGARLAPPRRPVDVHGRRPSRFLQTVVSSSFFLGGIGDRVEAAAGDSIIDGTSSL